MIIPLVFFDLSKLLFLGFLQLENIVHVAMAFKQLKVLWLKSCRYTCTNNISQTIIYKTLGYLDHYMYITALREGQQIL